MCLFFSFEFLQVKYNGDVWIDGSQWGEKKKKSLLSSNHVYVLIDEQLVDEQNFPIVRIDDMKTHRDDWDFLHLNQRNNR